MKSYLEICLCLFCVVSLFSCSNDEPNEEIVPPAEKIVLSQMEGEAVARQNGVSFKMLRSAVASSNGGNASVSPYSVIQLFAMLANGAEKEDVDAVVSDFGFSGMDISEINAYYKKMNECLTLLDPKSKFEMSNGLWASREFEFNTDFLAANKTYYNAVLGNFQSYDDVVKWYKNNASKNISSIIEEQLRHIDGDLNGGALNNTIYFKGDWKNKFDKKNTSKAFFHGENGDKIASLMTTSFVTKHYIGGCYDAIELPYGNGAYSMVAILPDKNHHVDDVLDYLSENGFDLSKYEGVFAGVYLPKYGYTGNVNMMEVLRKSECDDAIDYSYAGVKKNGNYFIGKILQTVRFDMNENGTVAAASTIIGEDIVLKPIQFKVDRPFVWFVKENSTNTILFMGKVGDI